LSPPLYRLVLYDLVALGVLHPFPTRRSSDLMINKMPGIYEDKFANLKVGYTFMMTHPGKKLLFMGQDFGQFHEWDEKVSLDWHLDRKSTRLNSSHVSISYAVFCLKIKRPSSY